MEEKYNNMMYVILIGCFAISWGLFYNIIFIKKIFKISWMLSLLLLGLVINVTFF